MKSILDVEEFLEILANVDVEIVVWPPGDERPGYSNK